MEFKIQNCSHISNQSVRICVTVTFCEETKMPKFAIKNAILGYF